jgi:glucose-6-phosphate isomerase
MFEYDDSYCYVGGRDSQQISKNKLILSEIINELQLKVSSDTPYYKVLCRQNKIDYLGQYNNTAKKIRENFRDLVVISMGGAALNPQSMLKLVSQKSNINIHFLDNTDPIFFKDLIESLNLKETAFLTISNSGETLETITLLGIVLNQFKKHSIINYSDNFYFIINVNNSTLFKLATSINAKIYPHAPEISGRYASFTNTTTLIGLVAGLDMEEFISGGNKVFDNLWKDKEDSTPARAAITVINSAKPILVNLGYLQKFSSYLDWYSQIIAESLGKNSKGFTPFKSLAPNDHHSMLQLYLDGPKDKLFTMFHVKKVDENIGHFKVINNDILGNLANRSIENINNTIFNAALKTFKAQHIPFRTIILNDLSAKAVGAIMAHSMIEVILLGHLLGVNPFDQPSVELLKRHVRELLKVS